MAGTVIVLFTDVVDSTGLQTRLGDEAYDDVRRRHFDVLERQVDAHGGELVKRLGDGVMTSFGSASDAVSAAVAMQRAVDASRAGADGSVTIRIGVAAGDATREDGDLYGAPVVEASRLCDRATAGQILTSDVVRLLAGSRGGHEFVPVGELELKGLPDPVTASEILWTRAQASVVVPLPGPLAPHDGELAFSGRDEAFDTLLVEWKAALAGSVRTVTLAGEPGVGKSRLVAELSRAVHDDGATVLLGRCDEHVDAPFGPWREALRWLVRHAPDELLAEHVAEHRGELARIVPELARRVEGLPEPVSADPETERLVLFDAVASLLALASNEAPILAILDDVHWADEPSLLLLLHVLRADLGARLLVVAPYRDTDVDRAHPLSRVLADLRRLPRVTRVSLDGLDAEGIEVLLERQGGHELEDDGRDLAAALHAETEGNPFFIGEVLRHLVESGALVHEDGRWRGSVSVAELGLPEGVREVVGRRLEALPEDTNTVLGAASVLGREFDAKLLAGVCERPLDETLDALEPAQAGRLVDEVPGAPGRYAFAHALVQSVLAEELGTNRRVRLHRAAGRALEELPEPPLDRLAFHFGEAAIMGETDAAMRYALSAGEEAILLGAPEQAVAVIRRALDAAELAEVSASEQLSLRLGLARALTSAGHTTESLDVTADAFEVAMAVGDLHHAARAASEFGGAMAVWEHAGDERGVRQLSTVLDALPPEDSPLRAELLMRLAYWSLPAPGSTSRDIAGQAYEMAERIGDPTARQWSIGALAVAIRNLDYARLIELGEEFEALPTDLVDEELRTAARGTVAEGLLGMGRLAEVDAVMREHESGLHSIGSRHLLFLPDAWWTMRALLGGDFTEAERRIEEMAAMPTEQMFPHLTAAVQMSFLCYLRGDFQGAHDWGERCIALAPVQMTPYYRVYIADVGTVGEVRSEWEAHRELAPLLPEWTRPPNLGGVSKALRVLGEVQVARELHDEFADRAGEWLLNGFIYTTGPFDTDLGILADAAGDLDAAIGHHRAAVEQLVAVESPAFATRPRVELVGTLRRRNAPGDAEEADAVDAEARRVGTELGQRGWIDRLDRIADGDPEPWRPQR